MFDRFFDLDHPFFRPLWLRAAIVVVCFAWAGLEAYGGSKAWAGLFAAIGAYCVWRFFIRFAPRDEP